MNEEHNAYTRRMFLAQGVTLVSAASTIPLFLQQSANAMMRPLDAMTTSQPGVPEDRVLVVVQLGGGNDGLNTVVPYGNRDYYQSRPALNVAPPNSNGQQPFSTLPIDDVEGIGLHQNFAGFKALLDDGVASIVQGVGYPNPNRSHFTSMDIWHTADPKNPSGNGWIGRYFDNTCNGTPIPQGAISIGRTAPLAMNGQIQKPITFESPDLFRWLGEDLHSALRQPYNDLNRAGQLGGVQSDTQKAFLMRTALDAQIASDRIRAAAAKQPLVRYPGNGLARQLQMVGAMIRSELSTRVFYVTIGGFDTHASQAFQHANLLRQVGDSLNAFYKDLKAQGNSKRVLTMVFSEFGRRVRQNASGGTDHGTAAPLYLVGDMVTPGLLGRHPSLTDLDQGDLKYSTDFRSIYAAILRDWMGADDKQILGGSFERAPIIT